MIKNKDNQNAVWQTSAPRSDLDNSAKVIGLGLRNKYGQINDEYVFTIYVKSPTGHIYSTKSIVKKDAWSNVNYPDDFNGSLMEQGTYTAVFSMNDHIIACDGFNLIAQK